MSTTSANDSVVAAIQQSLKNMDPKNLFTQIANTGSNLDQQIMKEFKTADPGRQFVLLHESWWVTLAWMKYVELVLNPNTDYSDINNLFSSLQGTANDFTGNVEQQTVALAQGVMNHAENAIGHMATIKETLFNSELASSAGARQFAKAAFSQAVTAMKSECQAQQAAADKIKIKMNSIVDQLNQDQTITNSLKQKYLSQEGTITEEIKNLQAKIPLEKINVDNLHSQYERWCKLAETAPVYLVIPFVGPFIAVADAAVFAGLAIAWLDKYNDAKDQMVKDQDQLNKDLTTEAHIEHALDIIGKVQQQLTIMIPLVTLLSSAWSNYAAQLDNLSTQANKLFDDGTSDDFNKVAGALDDLNTVTSDWTFVKTASETWAAIAGITKMPVVN